LRVYSFAVDSTDPTSNGISDQVLIPDSLATDGV